MSISFDEAQALHDAARSCGFDGHTEELRYKKYAETWADRMAVNRRLPVVVKRSFLYLDTLDTTFFYDKDGCPTCSYAGIVRRPSHDLDALSGVAVQITDMLGAMETARDHALMEIEAGWQA